MRREPIVSAGLPQARRFMVAALLVLALAFSSGAAEAQGATPPSAEAAEAPPIIRDPATVTFQRNYWNPEDRAHLLAGEFLGGDWAKRLALDPPPNGKTQVLEEIRYLHSLIRHRDERREEIRQQDTQPILPYFFPSVMMHQYSHPRTFELMNMVHALNPVVFHFKNLFNRARPSQLSPSLNPIILVPGHPAYPSGHAFQSWLIALIVAEVRPDARHALLAMAHRIAVNREVAGVHYPSDTRAGQKLADQVLELARRGRGFQDVLAEARAEWR